MSAAQEGGSSGRDSGRSRIKAIGGYELISRLGSGGMGAVFKARQTSMDRIVALKILPRRLARDASFVERFLREARTAGRLSHANIVSGIDVGEADGYYYFAMEYVEGETLFQLIKREGGLEGARALGIVTQIAGALAYAHSHDLIHRDVKPQNVILAADGTAKLCDLGLARSTEEDQGLTATGTALGTPHYIAPEQIEGRGDVDGRADLYALGATLYHMLAGKPPFTAPTGAKVMAMHLSEAPPPLAEEVPGVSPALAGLVARLLEKTPDDRYRSAEDLLEDLEQIAAGPAPLHLAPARRRSSKLQRRGSTRKTAPVEGVGSRPPWVVPAAVGGGLAAVAAAVLVVVLGLRGPSPEEDKRPPAEPKPPTEPAPPVEPARPEEPDPPDGEAAEKELSDLFAYAREWRAKNPGKYGESAARFEKTAARADELKKPLWAMKARDEAAAIRKAREAAVAAAFAKVEAAARELAATKDFDAAVAAAAAPVPGELAALLEPRLKRLESGLRAEAEKLFAEAFKAARATIAAGKPADGLAGLEELKGARWAPRAAELAELTEELRKASASAEAGLAAQRLARARTAFGKLLDDFEAAVGKGLDEKTGEFADARKLVRGAAAGEEMAPVKADVLKLSEVAEALALAAKARAEAWKALVGKEVTVQQAGAAPAKGKVLRVIDERTVEVLVEFRIAGQKGSSKWPVTVKELSAADREKILNAWSPATPPEHMAAGIKKLAAGELDAAEALLKQAADHPLAPRYLEKLQIARVGAAEFAANRAWKELLAAAGEGELPRPLAEKLRERVGAYEKAHGATKFAAGRADDLEKLKTRIAVALLVNKYAGEWEKLEPGVVGLDGRPAKFPQEGNKKINKCGAAYDSKRKRCVLYGSATYNFYRNDMWAYDPAANQWRLILADDPGADDVRRPRAVGGGGVPCTPFCYDSGRDRYWLIAGKSVTQVWSCDAERLSWRKGPNLEGLRYLALGYHPPTGKLATPYCMVDPESGEIEKRNKSRRNWSLFNSYWPCSGAATGSFTADEKGRFLVFGAKGKGNDPLADSHSLDPLEPKWHKLEPKASPGGRFAGRMVYHSRLKIWLLCGDGKSGRDKEPLRDTWVYAPHLSTWLKIQTQKTPPTGNGAAIWYDAAGEQVVYFADYQTWRLRLKPAL
jgi:serine/threonine-protein kinase